MKGKNISARRYSKRRGRYGTGHTQSRLCISLERGERRSTALVVRTGRGVRKRPGREHDEISSTGLLKGQAGGKGWYRKWGGGETRRGGEGRKSLSTKRGRKEFQTERTKKSGFDANRNVGNGVARYPQGRGEKRVEERILRGPEKRKVEKKKKGAENQNMRLKETVKMG